MVFVPFHHAYDGSQAIAQRPDYRDVYGKPGNTQVIDIKYSIQQNQTLKTKIVSDKNITMSADL